MTMKAYEVIDSPEKWCQGRYALDNMAASVSHNSPSACKWCLVGAIWKAYHKIDIVSEKVGLVYKRLHVIPNVWNDEYYRKWEEVYNILKELDI